MAIESCGNCNGPRGHGFSVVHFDIDINGTVCQKDSLSACVSHANFYTDITFPVRGRKNLEDFVGVGKYLELIDYPNAAMLVLKKSKVISRTEALLNAIFGIWPLVVINLLMAILAGLLLWSLVSSFILMSARICDYLSISLVSMGHDFRVTEALLYGNVLHESPIVGQIQTSVIPPSGKIVQSFFIETNLSR